MTALLPAQQANTAAVTFAVKRNSDAVIESKLKSIVIPDVDFNNVPLDRCLAVLGMISEEFDKTNDVSRGVNLVLKPSTRQSPEVTAKLAQHLLQ